MALVMLLCAIVCHAKFISTSNRWYVLNFTIIDETAKTAELSFFSSNQSTGMFPVFIPSTISDASGTYNVVGIGNNVFCGRSHISEITMPNTIEYIGNLAFADTYFTSLTISTNCKSIGDSSFGSWKCPAAKPRRGVQNTGRGKTPAKCGGNFKEGAAEHTRTNPSPLL